ncbi:MAG TPA: TIGR01906 family membrane protein [Longilinea sp.]|nr:TIGR01906 family membrane protein [Longilinea sp.]
MKTLYKILSFIVMLLLPFILIMTAVRLMLSPVFVDVEYYMPGFPPDTYGFTTTERLKWAHTSVDYLLNNQGISFLADQQLDANTPLYNERELSHMQDVKTLIQTMSSIWIAAIIFGIAICIWAWRSKWLRYVWSGLSWGGWLTLSLIGAALMAVALNFDALFTDFHHLFFTGDTWLFYYSDTLIRLFPLRFWSDAFIFTGALTAIGGLIFILVGRKMTKKLAAS